MGVWVRCVGGWVGGCGVYVFSDTTLTHAHTLPPQRSKRDFSNFDVDFISEQPRLTPLDRDQAHSINQNEFEGFTFTNSEFKDQL